VKTTLVRTKSLVKLNLKAPVDMGFSLVIHPRYSDMITLSGSTRHSKTCTNLPLTITSEDVISATHLSSFLLYSICVMITAQILAVDSSATEMFFGDKEKRRLLSDLKNLLLGVFWHLLLWLLCSVKPIFVGIPHFCIKNQDSLDRKSRVSCSLDPKSCVLKMNQIM